MSEQRGILFFRSSPPLYPHHTIVSAPRIKCFQTRKSLILLDSGTRNEFAEIGIIYRAFSILPSGSSLKMEKAAFRY